MTSLALRARPCPFCGAHLKTDPKSGKAYHPWSDCIMNFMDLDDEEELKKWNTRYYPTKPMLVWSRD